MIYPNIIKLIGQTPIIELKRYSPNPKIKILAKLEGNNPGGSIKDRIALFMFLDAQRQGLLNNGKTIIEATSGNTGIGLAMISSYLKLKFIAVMPENASLERKRLLNAYDAQIILTDGKRGTNYSLKIARELVNQNKNKYLMLDQFNNPNNVFAHYKTTGQEIVKQVPNATHFVAGMGTGGTLMGVGKRLKEFNKKIKVIGLEPSAKSPIEGLRNMTAYKPSIYHEDQLDNKILIKDNNTAFVFVKDLLKKEGLLVGPSAGANLWGAVQIAKTIDRGVIITIFPDYGDRYLSTNLFK